MKRTLGENRTFKGSVFVEFETKEEAHAFVATKDLKYKDNELTYMTKYVIVWKLLLLLLLVGNCYSYVVRFLRDFRSLHLFDN